jgi:hypothetical protein
MEGVWVVEVKNEKSNLAGEATDEKVVLRDQVQVDVLDRPAVDLAIKVLPVGLAGPVIQFVRIHKLVPSPAQAQVHASTPRKEGCDARGTGDLEAELPAAETGIVE